MDTRGHENSIAMGLQIIAMILLFSIRIGEPDPIYPVFGIDALLILAVLVIIGAIGVIVKEEIVDAGLGNE